MFLWSRYFLKQETVTKVACNYSHLIYDKDIKKQTTKPYKRIYSIFDKQCCENWMTPPKRMKFSSYLLPCTKSTPNGSKNLIWSMKCTNCPKKAINMGKTFWTEPHSLRFYEQQIKKKMLETWNFFLFMRGKHSVKLKGSPLSERKIFVSYITDRG